MGHRGALTAASAEAAERDVDVVVVGAGLAGLVAARDLSASGLSTLVLEARDRVGGRTLNVDIGDGKVVEAGGEWIGPSQHRVSELCRSLEIELFPTYNDGENVVDFDGKLVRYSGTIPKLSPAVLADVGQARWKLDRLARRVPLEAPWLAPNARRLDSQTFWSWMRRNMLTRRGRTLFEIATGAVWSVEPGEISLLHMLFYIHSGGGLDPLLDTEGGAQQDRCVGGTQLIAIKLAGRLGDAVVFDAPVRRIQHRAEGVTVHADGVVARARRAVFAIPPALCGRVVYDPPLSGYRDQLTQRLPLGSVIKCMAIYDEPFWRADGLSGQATSEIGPARIVFDNSPPDGSPGVLLGFLEGRLARQLGRLSLEERRRAVIDGFARLFGPRAARPERYLERSWAEEEWTRGCYGCYFPPGGWTEYGPALRAPVGPIHWASAETATVWNGYMDGAVQSGERAAREVLTALAANAPAPRPEEPAAQPA